MDDTFGELLEKINDADIESLTEGFLELAHEVPGIDKRGREILQVGYDHNLITDITNLPGDKEPDLETMVSDLTYHLSEIADFSKDVEKKKKLRQLANYFEEHEKDKGVIAGGYLQYLVIPLLIDSLKEEGLWDEQMNAPIFKLKEVEEQETPEDILTHKIEDELKRLTVALKGDYWFHEDIKISEVSVLNWIKENRPEFYKKAIVEPEAVEGSDVLENALFALGYMKEWHEVEYDELQTPEDRSNWKIAQGL